jgi:hypothetical protein
MISPYVKYFVREIEDKHTYNIIGERVFINNIKELFTTNNNTFMKNDNTFKYIIIIFSIFFLYFILCT